ncbi:MAG: fructosamine kinase family protein, partial [Chloroflexota bacterium]
MTPETDLLPQEVTAFCRDAGFGELIASENLQGGVISLVRRLTTTSQHRLIIKQSVEAPDDLYALEAESLQVLKAAGLRTPEVFALAGDFLLLEAVGSAVAAEPDWAAAGRAIAQLHLNTNARFGYEHDNYLGLLPQINTWTLDGHEFFGRYRMLRYLSVPLCEATLTAQDRQAIERLVARLPQLIPVQPAALLHGDLWHANVLFAANGDPVFIDPAVYFGWAEAELSMLRQYAVAPQAFYDAYVEVRPLEVGWWDRL